MKFIGIKLLFWGRVWGRVFCILPLILSLIWFKNKAFALSLDEAVAVAYKSYEEFEENRIQFLTNVETSRSHALLEFFPNIDLRFDKDLAAALNQLGKDSSTNQKNTPQSSSPISSSLEGQINLFSGGQSVVAIQMANINSKKFVEEYHINEQKIILEVVNTYLSCCEAQEKVKIAILDLETHRKNLEKLKAKFTLGEAKITDLEVAKVQLSSAKFKQASTEAKLEEAKAKFFSILNQEPKNIHLPPLPENIYKNKDKLMNSILKNNLEIKKINLELQSKKKELSKHELDLLPKLNLSLGIRKTLNGTSIFQEDGPTGKIVLHIPILKEGGRNYVTIRRLKKEIEFLRVTLDKVIKKVIAKSSSEIKNLESLEVQIKHNANALNSAILAHKQVEQEYFVGVKTIIDVLFAQSEINNILEDEIKVKKDYVLCNYNIKSLLGGLKIRDLDLKNLDYFVPEKSL